MRYTDYLDTLSQTDLVISPPRILNTRRSRCLRDCTRISRTSPYVGDATDATGHGIGEGGVDSHSCPSAERLRAKDGSGFDLSGDGVQHLQDLLNSVAVFDDAACGEGQSGFGKLKIPFEHMVTDGRLDPLEGA